MSPKESFWIGAKGGLFDEKHYVKMRESVWLFMYFLLNQTGLNEAGEGVVRYGHPLTLERISNDSKGIKVRTIRLWLARLKRGGYVRTEMHSNKGIKVWIAKGKSKTKTPRIHREVTLPSSQNSRHDHDGSLENSRHDAVESISSSRHENVASVSDVMMQSPQNDAVTIRFSSPISKGSIPKDLSYYNNDAAAKAAADVSSLLRRTAGENQLAQSMSQAQYEQRRRFLLKQKDELMRVYGSAGSKAVQ
jgi:hypothetical protein